MRKSISLKMVMICIALAAILTGAVVAAIKYTHEISNVVVVPTDYRLQVTWGKS